MSSASTAAAPERNSKRQKGPEGGASQGGMPPNYSQGGPPLGGGYQQQPPPRYQQQQQQQQQQQPYGGPSQQQQQFVTMNQYGQTATSMGGWQGHAQGAMWTGQQQPQQNMAMAYRQGDRPGGASTYGYSRGPPPPPNTIGRSGQGAPPQGGGKAQPGYWGAGGQAGWQQHQGWSGGGGGGHARGPSAPRMWSQQQQGGLPQGGPSQAQHQQQKMAWQQQQQGLPSMQQQSQRLPRGSQQPDGMNGGYGMDLMNEPLGGVAEVFASRGDDEGSSGKSTTKRSGDSDGGADIDKEKGRGSYRCGRCGVPKKGHICPYQPKLKRRPDEPPPVMRNAALQVEMDEFMTLRRLNLEIQGFPESYANAPLNNMVVGEPHPLTIPMSQSVGAGPNMPMMSNAMNDLPMLAPTSVDASTGPQQPELLQTEAATKPDLLQTEAAKPDLLQTEAAKPDLLQTEAAKPDLLQTEAAKPDLLQTEAAKPEGAVQSSPQASPVEDDTKA